MSDDEEEMVPSTSRLIKKKTASSRRLKSKDDDDASVSSAARRRVVKKSVAEIEKSPSVRGTGTRLKVKKVKPPATEEEAAELAKKKLKKKKKEMAESGEIVGSDIEGETPKRLKKVKKVKKPEVIANMPDLDNDKSERKTRTAKLKSDDASKSTTKEKKKKKKPATVPPTPLSPTASSVRSAATNFDGNASTGSASEFDVEYFIKTHQAKKKRGSLTGSRSSLGLDDDDLDGASSGKPAFDVAAFVNKNKSSKQSVGSVLSDDYFEGSPRSHKEDERRRIEELEATIKALNRQLEDQGSELSQALSDVASYKETKNELTRVRQQLSAVQDEKEALEMAAGSASIESLHQQLEEQSKQLKEALKKVREGEAAQKELLEMQTEFNIIINEKDDLIKALDSAEKEMGEKNNRILSLEKAVESQLDTIETLEEKLDSTEDELFQMEEDLKELQKKGSSDDSIHSKERVVKLDNMRLERLSRADSLQMERQHSQRLLSNSSNHTADSDLLMKSLDEMEDEMKHMGDGFDEYKSTSADGDEIAKRKAELAKWEKELSEREQQLDADREQGDMRELRLEEWEQDLAEKEAELKNSADIAESEKTDEIRRELEERERLLADSREALEIEKAELAQSKKEMEKERERINGMMNGHSNDDSPAADMSGEIQEKEQEILELKELCEKLREEKLEMIRTQEQEDLERDQELRRIQQDIHAKLLALNQENEDLRSQLESGIGEGSEEGQEVSKLKALCEKLKEEKLEMIRTQEKEDLERDQELRRIQQDIHAKLQALNEDNENLRSQLEEAEQKAAKVSGLQKVVNLLEDEVRSLRRADGSDEGHAEAMDQHREGVARKLADMEEEKLNLAEEFKKAKATFEERLAEQESQIQDLENKLDESQRKLQVAGSGGGAFTASLLKEVSELKQKLRQAENGEANSGELMAKLKEKDLVITELNEAMMKLRLDMDDQELDSLPVDERMKNLEQQVAVAKAEAVQASRDHITKLRNEIRSLKESVRDLKKQIRTDKQEADAKLKKKDEAIGFFQAQMTTMTQELAKYQKREERKPGFFKSLGGSSELQNKIEELEEEVDRWKATNLQLEGELAVWKAEANELKEKVNALAPKEDEDDDIDDEGSMSLASDEDNMDKSQRSLSSQASNRGFMFSSNTAGNGDIDSELSASQRAMRTIGGLFSGLKGPQPPAAPRGLYTTRQDDD